MHIVFPILIGKIKLTEKSSRQLWKTIVPSITELQVRYKRSFRMETRTQGQRNTLSVISVSISIYVYIYIYIECFCIIRSSFLMYIFTHYWQKWLVDVILYRHEVQIRLKLIYLDFIFILQYGQRRTQVCFNSISIDSDYRNAVFMQCLCLWTADNALIFAVFFSWFL